MGPMYPMRVPVGSKMGKSTHSVPINQKANNRLYRLRSALSRLWQAHPPNLPAPGHVAALLYPLLNSG
jgi:hypothetical protein